MMQRRRNEKDTRCPVQPGADDWNSANHLTYHLLGDVAAMNWFAMDECQKWIVVAFVISVINLLATLTALGVLK